MATGTLVVSCSFEDDGKRWNSAHSRRTPLRAATVDALVKAGMTLIRQLATGRPRNRLGVTLVALTAEGFETCSDRGAILKLFQRIPEQSSPPAKRMRSNKSKHEDGHVSVDSGVVCKTVPLVWACAACTLENEAVAKRCVVCGALRGGSLPAAATLAQQARGPKGISKFFTNNG